MGLLFDGYEMPTRESLGDLDPSQWELGLDNQPADPWQHQINIVLQHNDTKELFTFSTSSKTGRRAVGNLLRHYERMQRTRPGELPVVRLGKGGYTHKDARVGWVDTPVFVVVGRAPRDGAAKSDTLNDPVSILVRWDGRRRGCRRPIFITGVCMPHLVSLPVVKGDGYPKFFCSEDPTSVARWVTAENRPGRGIYRIMNPLVEGARVHSKENLPASSTFMSTSTARTSRRRSRTWSAGCRMLPLKPTWITRSGHGWHVVWELKECVDRGNDYYELAIEFRPAY